MPVAIALLKHSGIYYIHIYSPSIYRTYDRAGILELAPENSRGLRAVHLDLSKERVEES